MEKRQVIQYIITFLIICTLLFSIWYMIDNGVFEGFKIEGGEQNYTYEDDEVCTYDPYVIKLKSKIINWVDSRVKEWPEILKCLDENKKKHLHSLEMCSGTSSYTLDKEKVYLCVKDENGEYYDENTMTHVLLHEFAHALCDEIGHTKKFDDIFEALMDEAHDSTCPHQKAKSGRIYDKDIPFPTDYCGLTPSDSYLAD